MEAREFFACRKCGTELFWKPIVLHKGSNVLTTSGTLTTPNSDEGGFSDNVSNVKEAWGHNVQSYAQLKCSSVFLAEAPEWATTIKSNKGRFACPKCNARVGSFSWSGAACSCGRWVTPAFQFQLSRVDLRRDISLTTLPLEGHALSKEAPDAVLESKRRTDA